VNGAESLVRTVARAGVEVCFANPGTTEMPLVSALDSAGGIRALLGLFEGVCTGAADGWARMTRRPALTLLHLGPGLANGLANLHNARRAHSPVVNLVGDQATWHRAADAPLTSDIESLAKPVSRWVRTSQRAERLAADVAEALAAAARAPAGVATLVVPADCQWEEARGPVPPVAVPARPVPAVARIDAVARRLRGSGAAALLLGGDALVESGLNHAARVSAASGTSVFCETFPARIERGLGRPALTRVPYFPDQAADALARFETLVLVGAPEPVAFFGYPDGRSRLAAQGAAVRLADAGEDGPAALEALADTLDAPAQVTPADAAPLPPAPAGPLDPSLLGAVLARVLPEAAIVVDEGATSGAPFWALADAAPPHTTLTLTGGAIGQGLPCATGAALACPDRPVVALQADGSALYTLQALWTQAREQLHVVTLLCANRCYRILQIEMARAGIAEPGPQARALTDLSHPEIDWPSLARSLGVPGVRADTAEALARELGRALAEPGPHLIEAVL
jgi:acetolactate synthase-1/2/3 large subunit